MNPSIESKARTVLTQPIPPAPAPVAETRDAGSQTTSLVSSPQFQSGAITEDRLRRSLMGAFRKDEEANQAKQTKQTEQTEQTEQAQHLLQTQQSQESQQPPPAAHLEQIQPSQVRLEDFRSIIKSDLRRGDIVLTYEAVPSSTNHKNIKKTQRLEDLNAIDNNCGMSEIVHAGIILRDDVENAERNYQRLGPTDHPYLSERGGIDTTNALRAIGSAVPDGTSLVYRATDQKITDNLVEDLKAKVGVQYSSMELGASLKGRQFVLPEGLAKRNTVNHILAFGLDKNATPWANQVTEDEHSDTSETAYAEADRVSEVENTRKRGPGATCSTFIVKGIQAALGKALIDRADPGNTALWESRSHSPLGRKVREIYDDFPVELQIDAKRNAPKTLQHLLETLDIGGEKMFERIGMLTVAKMAYPERKFNPATGEELYEKVDVACLPCSRFL